MKNFSRWLPTLYSGKWLKRIVFLCILFLTGFALIGKINILYPFVRFKCGQRYYQDCYEWKWFIDWEPLVLFLLLVFVGIFAWSFWDEYQEKKR
ncbi:hypothetical protein COU78_05560 [Candidatus Peregrinibacteria bacterium CG10_big_fil_rev_8_21_14_0_10_49_24]|nr:MAG: hypothetical protein COV83_03345 [Candidatus Peregrinibacteria bacterium CG11_big_fil_rev_8_21_14_0_20_49_14]PIR50594.1 MAG: hypothetical protein COU78_05560 [Candidatus Peregrinibacteria bacterium CG10_big_fil_rev_8_21_14_0_10_49_24]PJA67087.1 MAG: hypothetical protein CO157_06545 [Candidatus Peregrinibacteria bacterium CG_4_9_14_3_um_filter_49_12]